jgi:hypothetical protein
MLRFAFIVGLLGLTCSAMTAALSLLSAAIAATAGLYYVLFASVFFSFGPAVLGHPARTASGGQVSVGSGPVLRSAAPWTLALAGAAACAFAAAMAASFPFERFSITTSSLRGRPDRQLLLACFFAVFHAVAVMTASSGMRYSPGPPPDP